MPHGCMGVVGPTAGILSNNMRFEGPTPIVDLGCGYGFMAAMVKTLWPLKQLTGIEAQERYRNPMWELYQDVRIADVRTEVPRMIEAGERFEIGFLFEILEHLTHADGEALMSRLQELAPRWIMSTPDSYFGARWHEWDRHQTLWSAEELEAAGWQLIYPRGANDRDGSMDPLSWAECGWPMHFGVLGQWDLSRKCCYELRSEPPKRPTEIEPAPG